MGVEHSAGAGASTEALAEGRPSKVITYDLSMSEIEVRVHLRAILTDVKDKKAAQRAQP